MPARRSFTAQSDSGSRRAIRHRPIFDQRAILIGRLAAGAADVQPDGFQLNSRTARRLAQDAGRNRNWPTGLRPTALSACAKSTGYSRVVMCGSSGKSCVNCTSANQLEFAFQRSYGSKAVSKTRGMRWQWSVDGGRGQLGGRCTLNDCRAKFSAYKDACTGAAILLSVFI